MKARFKQENIYASTMKLLSDGDLQDLGLRLGDRVSLRDLCSEAIKSKTVSQEVRSILSPLPFSARLQPPGSSSTSTTKLLDRRPKRKGKSRLALEKYREVIVGTSDFEFMEASGKCMCVPAQRTSFKWTGRAVKQLAGVWAVYVRLRPDRSSDSDSVVLSDSSSSSDCLPQVKVIRRESAANQENKSKPCPPQNLRSSSRRLFPSTSQSKDETSTYKCAADPVPSNSHLLSSPLIFMFDALPHIPKTQVEFVFKLQRGDVERTTNFFLEGATLSSVLGAMRSGIYEEEEGRIQVIDFDDIEYLTKAALDFYQGVSSSRPRGQLVIDVVNGVDGGGVRRQFMGDVLANLTGKLFEGEAGHLRPILKQSSVSSGILVTMGRVLGHSIILDGHGFPCLSKACFVYSYFAVCSSCTFVSALGSILLFLFL